MNFDSENYLSEFFFSRIDPSLKCQLFKSKYFDNEKDSTGGNLSFVAFMGEVHLVFWRKTTSSFENNSYNLVFYPDLTPRIIQSTQRRVPVKLFTDRFLLYVLR